MTSLINFDSTCQVGVDVILGLQKRYVDYEWLMTLLSHAGDPRYAFTIYFPLLFSLNFSGGIKLLWVASVTEWLNIIFKWLLHGDRPFWWVHETSVYKGESVPVLRQTPQTCETGPGSPSGHCMVTAAVGVIVVHYLYYSVLHTCKSIASGTSRKLFIVLWLAYCGYMLLIGAARLYIATHFPHQVVAGLVAGFVLGTWGQNFNQLFTYSSMRYFTLSSLMLVGAYLTYVVLIAAGQDPNWSVHLAVRWCSSRSYISVDTTPFNSVMRTAGVLLGLGVAIHSRFYHRANMSLFPTWVKLLTAVCGLGLGKAYEYVLTPALYNNVNIFYALSLLVNAVFVYICVALLPCALAVMCRASPKHKFKKVR